MTPMIAKTDWRIQQDVLRELQWDSRVDETEVGVGVHNGTVTLTGTVGNYAGKPAAADAAHRVAGVLDVANDLTVKVAGPGARTDTEIAQAVRQALEWDTMVPHERIQSTVSNGWVTLTGSVDRWNRREDAARAIRNLYGVSGVINHITVSAPQVDPADIQAAIEQALERRAEREARRIIVEVFDGTVRLTGRVHSWWEKQAVVGAAGHATSIHTVKDELIVDPLA